MNWGPYSEATHWAVFAEDGRGVKKIIAKYTASVTDVDNKEHLEQLTWYDNSPAVNSETPYLWKKIKVEFTDGTQSDDGV